MLEPWLIWRSKCNITRQRQQAS